MNNSAKFVEKVALGVAGIRSAIDRNQAAQTEYTKGSLAVIAGFQQAAQNNPAASGFMKLVENSSIRISEVGAAASELPQQKASLVPAAVVLPMKGATMIRKPQFPQLNS